MPRIAMSAVYLDHAATTPVRDEVRTAMAPYAHEAFGNPSSLHRWGRAAAAALENARAEIAEALGARPGEIRFVRGGTESDNLAVMGSLRAHRAAGHVPTLVTTRIEHSAVLEPAEALEERGEAEVVWLDVGRGGTVDAEALDRAISRDGTTVSVMWVNNETGLILPVRDVAASAATAGAVVHTDASQAIGKVPVDLRSTPVHLLTATGHKVNGPKGAGILFVREDTPLEPLLRGGGQERSLRPGTEDVAGAVGLATAIRLAVEEQAEHTRRLTRLRDRLETAVRQAVPDARINASEGPRAPHVSSVGLPGVEDGDALLMAMDLEGVAVSGGSACHSGAGKASHVIAALYGPDDTAATVRFSFGRETSDDEVDRGVVAMRDVVERLRGTTPVGATGDGPVGAKGAAS